VRHIDDRVAHLARQGVAQIVARDEVLAHQQLAQRRERSFFCRVRTASSCSWTDEAQLDQRLAHAHHRPAGLQFERLEQILGVTT
jgi:hypothetical protein